MDRSSNETSFSWSQVRKLDLDLEEPTDQEAGEAEQVVSVGGSLPSHYKLNLDEHHSGDTQK